MLPYPGSLNGKNHKQEIVSKIELYESEKDKVRYNDHDFVYRTKCKKTGVRGLVYIWRKNITHRLDGPAIDLTDDVIHQQIYMQVNAEHREGSQPSFIETECGTDKVLRLRYKIQDEFHRVRGPAHMHIYPATGIVRYEAYYEHGRHPYWPNHPIELERDVKTGVAIIKIFRDDPHNDLSIRAEYFHPYTGEELSLESHNEVIEDDRDKHPHKYLRPEEIDLF